MIPFLLVALGAVLSFPARVDSVPVARNVLVVTLDGLRWQELFAGADSALLAGIPASAEQVRTREAFWRGDPITRRQTLLPFSGQPSPGTARSLATGSAVAAPG